MMSSCSGEGLDQYIFTGAMIEICPSAHTLNVGQKELYERFLSIGINSDLRIEIFFLAHAVEGMER